MSTKKHARIAGLLYIICTFPMAFTELYVRSELIVWGDPQLTIQNIVNSPQLYRIGFITDMLGITLFILAPLALYRLFKEVNRTYAKLMVIIALISIPIMALNMLNHFAVLKLTGGAEYLNAFQPDQQNALAMMFLEFHSYGYLIAQIFFGLWLLPFGILVYKSGFIPKILGIFLAAAAFGYVAQFLAVFLFTDYANAVTPITLALAGIAELGIMFWLVIVGVRMKYITPPLAT